MPSEGCSLDLRFGSCLAEVLAFPPDGPEVDAVGYSYY